MTIPGAAAAAVLERLVATVAGREIHIDRVDRRLAELRRGPRARHIPPDGAGLSADLRRWVVQELVTEAVLEHEARAAGIASGSETAELAAHDVARLVAHVTAGVTVPEADLRAYYERNHDLYARPESRRIRHAVLVQRRLAMAMVGDGDVPGEPQEIRRGELAGPVEEAVFAASVGDVVGPLRSELGWHIARVDAVIAAGVIPYADARSAIESELLVAARARAFDEWLDRRRAALVVIEPAFEHPGHPRHGVPSHRH